MRSNRGEIVAKAVVTKRSSRSPWRGRPSDTVGIPITGGSRGSRKPGYLANAPPFVGDANVQTPEFKAFIVNVEKLSVA